MGWSPAWRPFAATAALDVAAAVAFLAQPLRRRIVEQRRRRSQRILASSGPVPGSRTDRFVKRHRWLFLEECARLDDAVEPAEVDRARLG